MTQPATPAPQVDPAAPPTPTPPVQPPAPAAPPWGTPEQFNAETAWKLVQNLRGDNDKHKARIAELTPFEQKAKELEDANKTELQRAQEQLAAAQKTAAEHAAEALRVSVAYEKGLTPAQAKRLVGATREALEADADELIASFPAPATPPATPPAPGRTPVEALRPGGLPNPPAPGLDEQIAAAMKDGNVRLALQLQNSKLANASPP